MSIDGNALITGLVQWELKQLIKDALAEYGIIASRPSPTGPDSGRSVEDVKPAAPPEPRQGIDYRTALDLIQFEAGSPERLACTNLPDGELLAKARAERNTPDGEKRRFAINR
jgi:hypothetical protein